MTLSQQIALGILTSVLGAAFWEFLNHVFPEIKSSVCKTVAACYRASSKIYFSFKKTTSLIGDKLNITFFVKFVKDAAVVVVCIAFYGLLIIGALYAVGTFAERVFARPSRDYSVTSLSSGTCDCSTFTRSTYTSTSRSEWGEPYVPRRYNPQPNDQVYYAPASPNIIRSAETSGDCPPARKGRKSQHSRKSIPIVSAVSNSYPSDGGQLTFNSYDALDDIPLR